MDRELLSILACPKCKGSVKLERKFLICRKCKLAFPVIEGIPDMLLEDAWPLEKASKSNFEHELKI